MPRRWFFASFSLSSAFFAACLASACQSNAPERQAQSTSAIEEVPAPEPIDLSNASWRQVTAPYAMLEHTATALDDGRVLVLGGIVDAGEWQATTHAAYAFSPGSDTWTSLPSMFASRASHSATKLRDGRVVVFGGTDQAEDLYAFLNASEVFNPLTSTWEKVTTTPSIGRSGHAAVLLDDGTVLAIGGNYDDGVSRHVNLYHPYDGSAGAWYDAPWLPQGRLGHTATLFPSGTLLVAGGHSSSYTATDSGFVSRDAGWSNAVTLTQARAYHTATLLQNGRILLAGGRLGSTEFLSHAELVEDPQGGPVILAQQSPSPMNLERAYHTAGLLPDGRVLVVGGRGLNGTHDSTEIYDPQTYSWSLGPSLTTPRSHHAMVVLPGRMIVVGGIDDQGTAVASVEVLEYGKELGETCSTDFECFSGHCADGVCCDTACDGGCVACRAALKGSGEDGTCGTVPDGTNPRFMCAEGMSCDAGQCAFPSPCPVCDDLGGAAWRLVTAPYPMLDHAATALDDGSILVTGGRPGTDPQDPWEPSDLAFTFRPGSDTWTSLPSMGEPRLAHSATKLVDGRVFVTGGWSGTSELFDPAASTWISLGENPQSFSRLHHTAVLVPDGKVVVIGGIDEGLMSSVEIYDPSDGPNGSLSVGPDLEDPLAYHTATVLPDGAVFIAGGLTFYEVEYETGATYLLESPYDDYWKYRGWLYQNRKDHTATLLADGRVLFVGGSTYEGTLGSAEIFDPAGIAAAFAPMSQPNGEVASLRVPRALHTAATLPDGRILVVGGINEQGVTALTEIYDPAANEWKYGPTLNVARAAHELVVLPNRIVVLGGFGDDKKALASAEVLAFGKDLGEACTADVECSSDHCVDGVCCNSPCEGACVACTAALKGSGDDGVCGVVAAGTNPRLGCTDGMVCQSSMCAAPQSCANQPNGAPCGDGKICQNGECLLAPLCWNEPDGTECGDGMICQSSECVTAPVCWDQADGTECGDGKICQAGACVTAPVCWDQPDGTECGDGKICQAGECVAAPSSACAEQADGTLCDEGDGCTVGICRDGACVETHRLDGTRCEGGICIAGQCRLDPTPTPPSEDEVDGGTDGGNVDGEGSAGNGRDDAANEDGGGGCSLAPSGTTSSSVATSFAVLAAMGLLRRRRAARP